MRELKIKRMLALDMTPPIEKPVSTYVKPKNEFNSVKSMIEYDNSKLKMKQEQEDKIKQLIENEISKGKIENFSFNLLDKTIYSSESMDYANKTFINKEANNAIIKTKRLMSDPDINTSETTNYYLEKYMVDTFKKAYGRDMTIKDLSLFGLGRISTTGLIKE